MRLNKKTYDINVVSEINSEIWQRQIPSESLTEFANVVFTQKPVFAHLYVFYGTDQFYTLPNKNGRCVYFIVEPRNLKSNSIVFLKQFDSIFGSIPRKFLDRPNFINTQPSLPWHIGVNFNDKNGIVRLKFNDLIEIEPPLINAVSVITSNKNISTAHQQRLTFIYNLKKIMGPDLHIFGRGINPISDKFEALSKYRYHLALENNSQTDYWSEKVADPLIALNKVFYSGGENINHYFSERAVKFIDINNPVETAKLILKSIRDNSWEQDLSIIRSEKAKILGAYNFVNIIKDLKVSTPNRSRKRIYRDVLILPSRILTKLKRKIGRIVKIQDLNWFEK
jgi:hypothetical protein